MGSIQAAFGRVIDGLSPEMPAGEAIRLSLGGRLRAVDELLPVAAEEGEHDARAVHRLRVATRRAAAAIRAFQDDLPKKRRKRTLGALKEIRAGASIARASDVDLGALGSIQESTSPDQLLALAFVMGVIATERDAAAKALAAHCAGDIRKRLRKASNRLVKSAADAHHDDSFLSAAESAVDRQFAKAVDAAAPDLMDINSLHQLRIECKRLRYTLEAVGPCADELGLRAFYDVLVESQDQFGAVNDAHELAARVEDIHDRFTEPPFDMAAPLRTSLATFRDALKDRSTRTHQSFLAWWSDAPLRTALVGDVAAPATDNGQPVQTVEIQRRDAEETTP